MYVARIITFFSHFHKIFFSIILYVGIKEGDQLYGHSKRLGGASGQPKGYNMDTASDFLEINVAYSALLPGFSNC